MTYSYVRKLTNSAEDVIDLSIEIFENTDCTDHDFDKIVDLIISIAQGTMKTARYTCKDGSKIKITRIKNKIEIEIYNK